MPEFLLCESRVRDSIADLLRGASIKVILVQPLQGSRKTDNAGPSSAGLTKANDKPSLVHEKDRPSLASGANPKKATRDLHV
ncbi:hypothetical protein MSAN_00973000 [Mycena sanguinolenta]|uniref:Uncharacterized protein n=1 Tax=Mycena sanguinolenta TaxID=230812 RepID=A0A8H6YVF8_9AGAR|nr:hypothetical protein MSAN_00973000 [Mycena sanguinolenta]